MSVNLGKIPHHPNEKHRIPLPDGVPRPPILGQYVAKRGQGKSTAAIRLLSYYVNHHPPVFHKNLIFIISPTAESQHHLWDHIGIPQENIHSVSTATEVKQIIDQIIVKLAEEKKKYDDDEEYMVAYRRLIANQSLTPRQETILVARNCMPLTNPAEWPRPFLLLDDLSHMKVLDKPWFISLCLRHRHVAGGVSLSMIIICQSLRGGLSRVVRQNCSLICLFSTHSKDCIDDLYKECSHLLDREEFEAVFEAATQDFHSFLAVDLSQTDPNKVFSKDFAKWYEIRNKHYGDSSQSTPKKDAKSSQPPERLRQRPGFESITESEVPGLRRHRHR